MFGHVEGRKKLSAWLAFKRLKNERRAYDADEEIYAPGMYLTSPISEFGVYSCGFLVHLL
jgi:hypothetical protein